LLILAENPPEGLSAKTLQQAKQMHQQSSKALAEAHAALKGLHAQLTDSEVLLQLQQKLLLAHDGVWGSRWHQFSQAVQRVWDDVVDLMTASIFKIGDTPVTLLGLIRIVIFLTLAWWASYWLRQGLQRVASRNQKIAPHTAYTLGRLIHYLIMIVGTVVALSSVGIDFSNIAWIAGALSVGIGFGLQDVVKNFVAGLIVMFEKTLKVGDFIELPSGISGTVKEISLRSTLITTGDNLEVVVPNAEFTSGRVVNWTLSDAYRRVHIPFAVSLQADKRQVVDAVLLAASRVPYTISEKHREPQVVLGGLEGKMSFELLVWIKQGSVKHAYGVKASYLWHIESALREKGIELV
jgi:small-conductance mechanosensitive channel